MKKNWESEAREVLKQITWHEGDTKVNVSVIADELKAAYEKGFKDGKGK